MDKPTLKHLRTSLSKLPGVDSYFIMHGSSLALGQTVSVERTTSKNGQVKSCEKWDGCIKNVFNGGNQALVKVKSVPCDDVKLGSAAGIVTGAGVVAAAAAVGNPIHAYHFDPDDVRVTVTVAGEALPLPHPDDLYD